MRPILALNCLLQIEPERSEEESSVGDALALAFCCARFCSASLILFASYSPAPLFMRPRHFVRLCAICSHDCRYVEVFKGVLVPLLLTAMGAFSYLKFSIEDFLWQTFIRHSGKMACPYYFRRVCILRVPALFKTSVSGILSCHFIFRSFLRQLLWKWFSLLACRW